MKLTDLSIIIPKDRIDDCNAAIKSYECDRCPDADAMIPYRSDKDEPYVNILAALERCGCAAYAVTDDDDVFTFGALSSMASDSESIRPIIELALSFADDLSWVTWEAEGIPYRWSRQNGKTVEQVATTGWSEPVPILQG